MQSLDHRAELVPGGLPLIQTCQAWVGAKKRQRVVTPVVMQTEFVQTFLIQGKVHRQEADGCDAKLFQVLDGRIVRQAGEGAAQGGRKVAVETTEALDMYLINDRTGQ